MQPKWFNFLVFLAIAFFLIVSMYACEQDRLASSPSPLVQTQLAYTRVPAPTKTPTREPSPTRWPSPTGTPFLALPVIDKPYPTHQGASQ